MQASNVLATVRRILGDGDDTRVPAADKLRYLNSALRMLVELDANAYRVIREHQLSAGSDQALPADGVRFLQGERTADGRTLNNAERKVKDAFSPYWRQKTPSVRIRECLRDDDMPRHFWVDPPVPEGANLSIWIRFGAVPPELVAETDALPVSDTYEMALVNLVLHLCYLENTDAGSKALAQGHFTQAANLLGVKVTNDAAVRQQRESGR